MQVAKISTQGIVTFTKIDGGLEAMQAEVGGGLIEFVRLTDESLMVVNEEGLLKGFDRNVMASQLAYKHAGIDTIVGDVFIMAEDESDFGPGEMFDLI